MSVVSLDKPTAKERVKVSPRRVDRRAAAPEVKLRARVLERRRSKSAIVGLLLVHSMMFSMIAGLTYGASSLYGQVMVESARRDRIEAKERADQAKKGEVLLRERLDKLTQAAAIDEWAFAHGFRAPDGLGQPAKLEKLVASRR
jgi:hypothetical protein